MDNLSEEIRECKVLLSCTKVELYGEWGLLPHKVKEGDWLYIYTGTKDDIIKYISILVTFPAIVIVICHSCGLLINMPLTYIAIDGLLIRRWWQLVQINKIKVQETIRRNAMGREEQINILRQKIQQLEESEKRAELRERKEERIKQEKKETRKRRITQLFR